MTCGKLSNPGPFNEKQTHWLTLQLCLVTVGVTEWIECSRFVHLLPTNDRRKLTPGSVRGPLWGRNGKKEEDDYDDGKNDNDDDDDDDYNENDDDNDDGTNHSDNYSSVNVHRSDLNDSNHKRSS